MRTAAPAPSVSKQYFSFMCVLSQNHIEAQAWPPVPWWLQKCLNSKSQQTITKPNIAEAQRRAEGSSCRDGELSRLVRGCFS